MRMSKLSAAVMGAAWITFVSATALAQGAGKEEKGGDDAAKPAATDESAEEGKGADADEKKPEPAKPATTTDATADAAQGDSPVELPGKTYHFVGARYRGIIIPKFMMNLFGDGGRTVYIHSFGPEFAIRKDAFEYVFGLWWAGYYMDETPFKASNDPDTAWEVVKSDLNVIFLTADFLWSQELGPQFAVNYGMGAGFGLVFGDLHRTQAYPPGGNPNISPYDWKKCTAPNNPPVGDYCGTDNSHYGSYTESSWANGGSKPIIFPWLVLQTGLRYKPSRRFVGRLDAGFGTSGFFIGLGADYGL